MDKNDYIESKVSNGSKSRSLTFLYFPDCSVEHQISSQVLRYKCGKDIIQPSFKASAAHLLTGIRTCCISGKYFITMWSKPNENRYCC